MAATLDRMIEATGAVFALPIARRLWQHARRNGTPVAIDADAEPRSAIAPNRLEQHSVATIPDLGGDVENLTPIVTDRSNP
jgi:hypothetical protein